MKLSFHGAAKTVTGSCFMLETANKKMLIDCGLFQGHTTENALNNEPFSFNPSEIDYLLLTHAHIDHSGRIPKLFIDGFKGQVIATKATVELCSIMLPDSGHIQEYEAEWLNKKRVRQNKHPIKPLYTMQNAIDCMKLFKSVKYSEEIKLSPNIYVKFYDAGHILGSAIIEIKILENNQETKFVFTGDLGNKEIPLIRDPEFIYEADYLIMESTYGDKLHKDTHDKSEKFLKLITDTVHNGGNVIIPSFAVGRTQEILYDLHINRESKNKAFNELNNIPVFVDSPLSISATEIYQNNLDCFDEEARSFINRGDNPLDFPGLRFLRTADESKSLNDLKQNAVILSASGMCEAGRIKHHLKHNLWKKENTILFVGFQAQGTLGRKILDGAKKVTILGEEISIEAKIESIDGFSGHADKNGLIDWLKHFKQLPEKIFIVHGEPSVQEAFAKEITTIFNTECVIPEKGCFYNISGHSVRQINGCSEINSFKFIRLSLIEQLETLREEINEFSDIIKTSLKNEVDDTEINNLKAKIKNIEKAIIDALK